MHNMLLISCLLLFLLEYVFGILYFVFTYPLFIVLQLFACILHAETPKPSNHCVAHDSL